MFPWGAIISLAGTALSGIMSARNNKLAKEEQDKEYARQQAIAQARAYEDPMMRSENQALLNEYDRRTKRQMDAADATGAILGETQEASLARQKAAMEGRADMMSNISARSSATKDYYLDQLEQSRQNQAAAEQQRLAERNQTYANLAANAVSAFGNIVDSYGTGKVSANKIVAPTTSTESNTAKMQGQLAAVEVTEPKVGKVNIGGIDYTKNSNGTFSDGAGNLYYQKVSMYGDPVMTPFKSPTKTFTTHNSFVKNAGRMPNIKF